MLGPLLHGGSVVLAGASAARSLEGLAGLVSRHRIHTITVVPSLLSALLQSESTAQLGSSKLWISSGEALSQSLAARFGEMLPDATLLDLYGAFKPAAIASLPSAAATRVARYANLEHIGVRAWWSAGSCAYRGGG